MADTSNFSWSKPTVGGDSGAWGAILNTLFDDIDSDLDGVKDTADGALQRSGGSMSGEIDILTARYVSGNLGATLTGTVTLNLDNANFFYGTMDGAITIAFSNVPAATDYVGVVLELVGDGSAITWPSSVKWPGGSAPDAPGDGDLNVYVLYTRDGGTTWRAALAMEASA